MNLYVHFPFCRSRCAYCALHSRAGATAEERRRYVAARAGEISRTCRRPLETVYFGGGSPALCDLAPLKGALAPLVSDATEFTIELHPLDATPEKLDELAALGVNRVSMGVQSLDDATLRAMGRGYSSDEAARAFARVRARFENAGVDLIVGYPHDDARWFPRLADWGLRHCSVYSLQNERGLRDVPDDDFTLDRVREAAAFLDGLGLDRYEISNYAVPGFECRHNLAVWRGEDYFGLGEGASGRTGRKRTRGLKDGRVETTDLSPRRDRVERTIFRLRTREGLDAAAFPEWRAILDRFTSEGLLTRHGATYRLTERGTEVCDAILAELPLDE